MAASWYAVLALAATALGATIGPSENQIQEKSHCGRVWLTVHSPEIQLGQSITLQDALELNWDFSGCFNIPRQAPVDRLDASDATVEHRTRSTRVASHLSTGAFLYQEDNLSAAGIYQRNLGSNQVTVDSPKLIGLFDERPRSWNNALSVFMMTAVEGHLMTNMSLGRGTLPAGWEAGVGTKGPHCLWPWVAAGNIVEIQAYNCLKIQPTWMEDAGSKINNLRIGDLAIAGTHNAGAWKFNTEVSSASRDSFILCQDRSIWGQLVHGIRYFDFRIAYYEFYPNVEDRYWLNHNLIRVRPLVPLLREIRAFLDATKEVVFLDAHHFPVGFYQPDGSPIWSVHAGLLEIVQRELGVHLAPADEFGTGVGTKGPTLQTLINADKRLLFSYVDNSIVSRNSWLWPILPHLWANTNSATELFQYLDGAISSSPQPTARSPLFSAMAQTTPTVLDILFLRGSLRENADDVNRNVTARLATRWRTRANIISTDFFLGNNVVDLSIMICEERASRL